MIVTAEKTHKRKRSQQEKDKKLAKKITVMRAKRGRQQLQQQQAEEKKDVERPASTVTLQVQRQVVDDLEVDWNANDADEVEQEKHVPAAWNMHIADVQVGDFVVLEATFGRPPVKGIAVAKVAFWCFLWFFLGLRTAQNVRT